MWVGNPWSVEYVKPQQGQSMKKLLMICVLAAVAGINTTQASERQDILQTIDIYQAEGVIQAGISNQLLLVSNTVTIEQIVRLDRYKRKLKWKKGRRILKRQKRKLRKVKRKVKMNHSRTIYT